MIEELSTGGSKQRRNFMDTLTNKSSQSARMPSAVDASGLRRRYLGRVDENVDLMFNDSFVERWEEANRYASSSAELLVMRLYMMTPTNWRQSILPWATNDVRIPINAVVLRTLRCRTNPVIRVVPGENTMFLARAFPRTLRGTNQSTGVFGMIHSFYSGVIIVDNNRIQVYNGVDAHGYVSGLNGRWSDPRTNDPGMTAVLVAGNRMPIAFSPFGNIGLDSAEGNDMTEEDTFTASIAYFEQLRQGRVREHLPPQPHPNNRYGVPIEHVLHEYWSRDTTMFAGPDCTYKKHVSSAGLLPTRWATTDLRTVLDGNAVDVSMPLMLQSSDEIGQRA